jgi:serine/threonine protein kinase
MVKKGLQKGGALIGKGAYGCVYYPALPCKHQKQYNQMYANSVMKLTDEPGINEIEISASLRYIDPKGNYFLPLQCETCEIDHDHQLVKGCDLYQQVSNYSRGKFKGYFSLYGGPSLSDILKEKRPLTIEIVWRWLSYLIESLNILNSAQITHNDVTVKNIVIGSDNLPRLIDFGISYYHDDMITTQYYKLHPLFISAFNTDKIDDLYTHYGKLPEFYNPEYVKGSGNDIILSYFNRARASRDNYLKEIIKPNCEKVDLFMLCDLFINYFNLSQFAKDDSDLLRMILELINSNLNPEVTKQFTIAQNLVEVKKINDFIASRKMNLIRPQSQLQESQTPKPKPQSQMIKLLPAGQRSPKV